MTELKFVIYGCDVCDLNYRVRESEIRTIKEIRKSGKIREKREHK